MSQSDYQFFHWAFDQGGVATLIAGFLAFIVGVAAVLAAFLVGRRQAEILAKQTDIQERHLALQELSLKSDLFERRYQVYAAVRDWLAFWEWEHRLPADTREPDVTPDQKEWDLRARFNRAIEEAAFLFHPSVHQRLIAVRDHGRQWSRNRRKMDRPLGTPGREEAFANDDLLIAELEQDYRDLPKIFGVDMKLSDVRSPEPPAGRF